MIHIHLTDEDADSLLMILSRVGGRIDENPVRRKQAYRLYGIVSQAAKTHNTHKESE